MKHPPFFWGMSKKYSLFQTCTSFMRKNLKMRQFDDLVMASSNLQINKSPNQISLL